MRTNEFLAELSNEKLAKYKTAASADATKADKEKNFARGNKRFSGIVKATNKQFANDAKQTKESVGLPYPGTYEQTNDMFKGSGQRRIGTLTTEDDQIDGMAQGEIREIIKNAIHIKNQLDKGVSLDGWMYSYVTTSNDHLNSVAEQINNPNIDEEKQRIDPKCWTGYKKQGTKMKGGTRVNNCVPVKESAILEGIDQVDEGWKSALGSAALAGAMALGAGAAHGRVVPDQDPGINRLTGKPIATQVAQDDEKPAAKATSGYSAEYLQNIIDGKITNRLISPEKATQLLQQQQGQQ